MKTLRYSSMLILLAATLFFQPLHAQDTPPPKSDTIDNINNFLACKGNKFSLCYYSGPVKQAGQDSLPCVVGKDGNQANCKCYSYDDGEEWNYVSIGSILNAGVRAETQADTACSEDGSTCLNLGNLATCAMAGRVGESTGECKTAPVCDYLGAGGDQPKAQTLYPDLPGDYSISTFSFRHAIKHNIGVTPCTKGLYAGCMTAPCEVDGDTGYSTCDCPTYDGKFQIGQKHLGRKACELFDQSGGKHVWSAANVTIPKSDNQ